ncbi:MAG: lytic transglycosylase domain-containing protein [Bacillota bacterium]|nr:lytic transglycosylase domain-containing protein [Bacillota bacterium]
MKFKCKAIPGSNRRKLVLLLFAAALFYLWSQRWNLLDRLFPQEYREIVEEHCSRYQLDPCLLMAMIREESRFDSKAVSHAGAQGLMQIMPETAEWITKKSGLGMQGKDGLQDPENNIRLGIWYLQWLRERYSGNSHAAVAAYNAGQTVVDRWLREGRWDGSLENARQIPYPETADYLRSVWRSYKIYNILQDFSEKPLQGSVDYAILLYA